MQYKVNPRTASSLYRHSTLYLYKGETEIHTPFTAINVNKTVNNVKSVDNEGKIVVKKP